MTEIYVLNKKDRESSSFYTKSAITISGEEFYPLDIEIDPLIHRFTKKETALQGVIQLIGLRHRFSDYARNDEFQEIRERGYDIIIYNSNELKHALPNEATPMFHTQEYPFCFIHEDTIYLPYNIYSHDSRREIADTLLHILTHEFVIDPKALDSLSNAYERQMKEDVEKDLAASYKKIEELRAEQVEERRFQETSERILMALVPPSKKYRLNNKVKNISFSGKLIKFTTEFLYTVPVEGIQAELGFFHVRLNIETAEIIYTNLTKRVVGYSGQRMHAPHVFANGHPCTGGYGHMIQELLAERLYDEAIDIVIGFLSEVTVNDAAGKHWWKWIEDPKVKEKMRMFYNAD